MFKTNQYYIEKMLTDIDFILEHMKNCSKEALEHDPVLTDSMLFRLIQISESSKNLTDEFKERNEQIAWNDITALRNRLVHDYGNVDMTIVYDTLTKDISQLKAQLIPL